MKFNEVRQRVANLIRGKILVGHSLWVDLSGEASPFTPRDLPITNVVHAEFIFLHT